MQKDHTQPDLPVAVISDGKPGHENQSLGIAEHLPHADILLLRHRLKESLSEAILRLRARLSYRVKGAAQQILEQVLGRDEVGSLLTHKPKAVIAAGTLSAGPCFLAGTLTGARTCICMKPSMIPLSFFDLAVLPSHDRAPDAPNILRTLAAPNRVSPKLLADEYEKWSAEFPPGDKSIIAWVIGGPSASAAFNGENVLSGLLATLGWASERGWSVWLSTARRTPESLETDIADLAAKHASLEWSLLWHRDRRNPLYAMFHRCRAAIVTSDSVSMIAEAASAGKGPVVFQTIRESVPGITKQDIMVDGLVESGYAERALNADELVRALTRLSTGTAIGGQFKVLDDTEKAAKRLLELLRTG